METRLKAYFIGILWFILSLVSSSVNDIIQKYVSLPAYEITFFRFFFGTITLIPFIMYYGIGTLKTSRPTIHFIRGLLLFLAISGWIYGLHIAQVTTATVVSFATPIFVLVLGVFFLSENIIWQRWAVTFIAFGGIFITLNPLAEQFNPEILVLVFATFAFAVLDIINKRFVIQESMISMLFYSAIVTAVLAFPFALMNWSTPTTLELMLLFILGASANLILFFILKAFSIIDATACAPYRYLELLFSAIIAYIVFGEIPKESTIWGALIVIPSTLFIIYSEKRAIDKQKLADSRLDNASMEKAKV
ncbi:MAG: DMT family transporter [Rickettsiaceae bacterium]|nr:DMT family transporter [Rickettsiaceae bacterium]